MKGPFKEAAGSMLARLHELGFDARYVAENMESFDAYSVAQGAKAADLTEALAEGWIHEPSVTSRQQVDKRVRAIKHLAAYITSSGGEAYMPGYRIKSDPPKPPTLMDDAELSAFFSACDRLDWKGINKYGRITMPVFFRLLYSTGMRTGEACRLRASDVDLASGRIEVIHSKGDKDRSLYVSESMLSLLREYDSKISHICRERAAFFPRGDGDSYENTYICQCFDQALAESGLSGKHPKKPTAHGFRHLFAVKSMQKCLAGGADFGNWIKYLSLYMGHAGPQETLYYLHSLPMTCPSFLERASGLTGGMEVAYEED